MSTNTHVLTVIIGAKLYQRLEENHFTKFGLKLKLHIFPSLVISFLVGLEASLNREKLKTTLVLMAYSRSLCQSAGWRHLQDDVEFLNTEKILLFFIHLLSKSTHLRKHSYAKYIHRTYSTLQVGVNWAFKFKPASGQDAGRSKTTLSFPLPVHHHLLSVFPFKHLKTTLALIPSF